MPSARIRLVPFATILLALAAGSAPADEPAFRFNGKDLAGFYTYLHDHRYDDPDGVFRVVDGELRISGKEYGGVTTFQEFADYRLVVEWRWTGETWPPRVDRARDSGVLVHAVGPDDAHGGHWPESFECQIIEGGTGDLLVVASEERMSLTAETHKGPDGQPYFEPGGVPLTIHTGRINWYGRDPAWKDARDVRGPNVLEKPTGEWNVLEVTCEGDKMTNVVNGKVVNVGRKLSRSKGKIVFQSEGAAIAFRKIEVHRLAK